MTQKHYHVLTSLTELVPGELTLECVAYEWSLGAEELLEDYHSKGESVERRGFPIAWTENPFYVWNTVFGQHPEAFSIRFESESVKALSYERQ